MSRVLSGMRPTGPLHLGHLLGALENWIHLQNTHECFFMVADLHALMGEYEDPREIEKNSIAMVIDWLASGIDPEKSTIFIQSQIPEHAELALILGMLTPLGWLERNPTYKEQLREIKGRDLTTYGFLGYPVLQAADILLYKADQVPVGEDQLAHLELAREIVRRFKRLYKKDFFPEPTALLTKEARILGTDRRKMSKSYGNAIHLSDAPEAARKKVQSMITDPARVKASDPGHPDACNVYSYYKIFSDDAEVKAVYDWCAGAKKGCTDCKKTFAEILVETLKPIHERRAKIAADPAFVGKILKKGRARAEAVARETMGQVKELLHLAK
ncbi:MAG: tryptophan--tRNA ligase [Candidatus Omnitrophica bacterium]|nr:tryptophan--tRNA ligase [Candidatus Omnitrophota bacterium]